MLKIAISDDDKDLCNLLNKYVTKYCVQKNIDYQTEIFNSCEDLFGMLRLRNNYDIIFLDIEFKDMNGIELGKLIRNDLMDQATSIIYVSAVEGYSMQLFKIHPFDFLIKPLTFDKVRESMDEYLKTCYLKDKRFRYLKYKTECEISASQIKYFQSAAKKITMYTTHETVEFYGQLSDCAAQEGIKHFILIHQSYLINPIYIDKFGFDYVIIKDNIQLPISRLKKKEVREQLLNL